MKRPVALFTLLVLFLVLVGTWFYFSNQQARVEYMRWEASEIDRRFAIAREITAGERDASESPWFNAATMGGDVTEGALRTALRNQLRSGQAWYAPYRIPAEGDRQ